MLVTSFGNVLHMWPLDAINTYPNSDNKTQGASVFGPPQEHCGSGVPVILIFQGLGTFLPFW